AVPDRVRAPDDAILAEGREELAHDMRRLVGTTHEVAPGGPELGVKIAGVALQAAVAMRLDQPIHAAAGGIVWPLLHPRLERRVIDEEGQVRVRLGSNAHVARRA